MSTITIPASEVEAGDVIDFGGQPLAVDKTDMSHGLSEVYIYLPRGGMWVAADLPITVTRPDPDAELIEVMAKAICAVYSEKACAPKWDALVFEDVDGRDEYREEARAALAAAREAGLL